MNDLDYRLFSKISCSLRECRRSDFGFGVKFHWLRMLKRRYVSTQPPEICIGGRVGAFITLLDLFGSDTLSISDHTCKCVKIPSTGAFTHHVYGTVSAQRTPKKWLETFLLDRRYQLRNPYTPCYV